MNLVNDWWEHHILENDAQYRQYLSILNDKTLA